MYKPNASKALADTIYNVAQQVQCNKPSQQLELECRTLASTIVHALTLHSLSDISTWLRWRMDTSLKPGYRAINELSPNNLKSQMNDVLNIREISKKKKSTKSKLDSSRAEIIFLKHSGYSLGEIRDWLRRYKRIQVERSTVLRKLDEWSSHGKT